MSRLHRLRSLLARPGAWLDAGREGYPLRVGDRRSRVVLTVTEAEFEALTRTPGLQVRSNGGWIARAALADSAAPTPPPGRPGVVMGERAIMRADGSLAVHAANLGQSGLTWLATRRMPTGQTYIDSRELAAGERLRLDAERAFAGPRLTRDWSIPQARTSGASSASAPTEAALAAATRVRMALAACGPWRPMIDAVCVRGTSLQAAEHMLGLRRRSGRRALRAGLDLLAAHYRL